MQGKVNMNVLRLTAKEMRAFIITFYVWTGLFLFTVLLIPGAQVNRNYFFKQISLEQGLSQSAVTCIIQDRDGFMWFGTQDGLNKYDGNHFSVFKYNPQSPNSISDGFIRGLAEDRQNPVIWIGTRSGGLNKLDRETETSSYYRNKKNDPLSIGSDEINVIYQDHENILWIGTLSAGLDQFNTSNGTFTHFRHNPGDTKSIMNDRIGSIYESRNGDLWIGTALGLDKWDKKNRAFIHYPHIPGDYTSPGPGKVTSICEGKENELWLGIDGSGIDRFNPVTGKIYHYPYKPDLPGYLTDNRIQFAVFDNHNVLWAGTSNGGLHLLDPDTGVFTNYRYSPGQLHGLPNNQMASFYQSNTGIIWIGTLGQGVVLYDPNRKPFKSFLHNPNSSNSLNAPSVRAVCEDSDGILWFGTEISGLNRYDPKTNKYSVFIPPSPKEDGVNSTRIFTIYEDRNKTLWFGTYNSGLFAFDNKRETFTNYRSNPANKDSLGFNWVKTITGDREGNLWIGTYGGGLYRLLDPVKKTFDRFTHVPGNPFSLSSNLIYSIFESRSGILWIGTGGGGLNRFNPSDGKSICYRASPGNPNSLSNDRVLCIYEDEKGILWIATAGGLNSFDPLKNKWHLFTEKDGLPNDVIYGILPDNRGFLWLSTNNGISKFSPVTSRFVNYNKRDGLSGDEFNGGAYFKSKSGELFFGGANGVTSFFPGRIQSNPHIPPIVITDFKVFNQPRKFNKQISKLDEIRLSYRDDYFSLGFVALNYTDPGKNKYAYKLEGFDEHWIYCGTDNTASYTNIDGGTYVFRVKGCNNDGVWNEKGASIRIIINPPFWSTIWFRLLIILLLIAFGALIFHFRTFSIRQKNKYLEKLNTRLNNIIREREKIEKALQASEEKYRNIIENSIDAHCQTDKNGIVLMVNPAGVHLLGYSHKEEILGKHAIQDFFFNPGEKDFFLSEIRRNGKIVNFELTLKQKNGEPVIVETSAHCRFNNNGEIEIIEGVFRDITVRKRTEKENLRLQNQLLNAKKMEAVGNLAGGMAHEFNNLIAVISGNAHLVLRATDPTDPTQKKIKAIINSANRCATLTDQLLSFSRKQMLKLKTANLNDLILAMKSNILRLIGDKTKMILLTDEMLSPIKVDSESMIQVIMGLVENAHDAMPDGGILTIQTENITNPPGREGHYICLSIIDTGIGMDEETLQHIFEPFFTTKEVGQGVGLDLSFVYGTITQHNGWIDVISAPGNGTSMKLFLPAFLTQVENSTQDEPVTFQS